MSTAFAAKYPEVMAEEFDADLVLLNLRSGEYFNITGAARAFLDVVLSGISPTSLSQLLGQTSPEAGTEAAKYFENLQKHALIRPVDCSPSLAATPANGQRRAGHWRGLPV